MRNLKTPSIFKVSMRTLSKFRINKTTKILIKYHINNNNSNNSLTIQVKYFKFLDLMRELCQKGYPNKVLHFHLNLTIISCQCQQDYTIFRAIQKITQMRIIKTTIIIQSLVKIKVVVVII